MHAKKFSSFQSQILLSVREYPYVFHLISRNVCNVAMEIVYRRAICNSIFEPRECDPSGIIWGGGEKIGDIVILKDTTLICVE